MVQKFGYFVGAQTCTDTPRFGVNDPVPTKRAVVFANAPVVFIACLAEQIDRRGFGEDFHGDYPFLSFK